MNAVRSAFISAFLFNYIDNWCSYRALFTNVRTYFRVFVTGENEMWAEKHRPPC